jgi:hypothetical protein
MTSFYQEQRRANIRIDNIIQSTILSKTELDISLLTLQITNQFEISDKAILKRINLWISSRSDLELTGNNILRVKEEKD